MTSIAAVLAMAVMAPSPRSPMACPDVVELAVDAALASYTRPDLRWLFERHLLALVAEFPSLSPSADTYTSEDGAASTLLNVHGLLAVSPAMPPALLLTMWLPQDYPYAAPMVYVFPAQASLPLVADHPLVDHRTGRVLRALPCLGNWEFPRSDLVALARSLIKNFAVCHPYANANLTPPPPPRTELLGELVRRLDVDRAVLRSRVGDDVGRLSAVQDVLFARRDAMGRAVWELGEERRRLERAVTAGTRHCDVLSDWLRDCTARPAAAAEAVEAAGEVSRQWVESAAAEMAADDAMGALAGALEAAAVSLEEYMRHVRVLAREQFFHCHRAKLLQWQLSKKN